MMHEFVVLYVGGQSENIKLFQDSYHNFYHILSASSAKRAFDILNQKPVDVVILDHITNQNPELGFLAEVQGNWPEIKRILLVEASTTEADHLAIDEMDLYWFLRRPFDNEQLAQVLQSATSSIEKRRERKLIDAKLQHFEKSYSISMDLLCIANTQGYFVDVNPQFENLLGYSAHELISRPFYDFLHPDDLEETQNKVKGLNQGKGITHFINRYRAKDGTWVWLSWACSPNKETGLLYGSAHNITEQVEAKRELSESFKIIEQKNAQLKEVQQLANLGSWEWDIKNNRTTWSDEACGIYGLHNNATLSFDQWLNTIHPEDLDRVREIVESTKKNKERVDFEFRILKPNGEVRTLKGWCKMELDQSGSASKMVSATIDITELKNSEEKLSDLTNQFKSLFEFSPEAILIHSFNTITHVNQAFLDLFGYKRKDELIGKPAIENLVYPEDYAIVEKGRKLFDTEGIALLPIVRHLKKDGTPIPCEVHVSKVVINDTPHLQVISRDISQRLKLERELTESEEKFRGIFESMVDIFIRVSNDGIIEMISPSVSILGYDSDEVLNKKIIDFYVNSEDRVAYINKVMEQGYCNHFEAQIYNKNGEIIEISSYGKRYRDRNGNWGIESVFRDISLQKRQQNELKIKEQRLRNFVEIAPLGIATNNMRGEFIEANDEFLRITGYTLEEINQLSYWDLTPEKYAEKEQEQLGMLEELGSYGPYEKEYIHKKGHLIPVMLNGIKITDEIGEGFIWSIVQDISETKKAEAELLRGQKVIEEQRQRLELSIKGAGIGTWDWDIVTNAMVYNERWAEMLGYKLEEIRTFENNSLKLFAHPEDIKKSDDLVQQHFAGKTEYYECEMRMKHKLGHWVWVLDRGKVFDRDENGKPLRMSGTHLDITKRKLGEIKLKKSEKRYSDLWSTVNKSSLVSITDTKGRIQFANSRFCEISGYSLDELNGQFHSIINSGYHGKTFWKEMWNTILAGKIWKADVKNKAKNGEFYWVETIISPIMNEGGAITGYLSIRYLITERVKLAEDKNQLLDALKEYTRQTSHELRAPLANLLGLSNLAFNEEFDLPEEMNNVIKMIHTSSTYMDSVIRQMNNALQTAHKMEGNKD